MIKKSRKTLIFSLIMVMIVILSLSLLLASCSNDDDLLIVRVAPVNYIGNETLEVYFSKINGQVLEDKETTFGRYAPGTDIEITVDISGLDEFIKYSFELKDGGISLGKIDYPENKFNVNNIQNHMQLSLHLIKEHIKDPDNPDPPVGPDAGEETEKKVYYQVYHKIGNETIEDGAIQDYIEPGKAISLIAFDLQGNKTYRNKFRFSHWMVDNKKVYSEKVNYIIPDTDEPLNFYAYYEPLYEVIIDKNIEVKNNSIRYNREGTERTMDVSAYITNKVEGNKFIYLAENDELTLTFKKYQKKPVRIDSWNQGTIEETSPRVLSYDDEIDVKVSNNTNDNKYYINVIEQILVPVTIKRKNQIIGEKNFFVDKSVENLYYNLSDEYLPVRITIDDQPQEIKTKIDHRKYYLDLGKFNNAIENVTIEVEDAFTLYELGLKEIGSFEIEKISKNTNNLTLDKKSKENFLGWNINDKAISGREVLLTLDNQMLLNNSDNGKVKIEVDYSTIFTNTDGYIYTKRNGEVVSYDDDADMAISFAGINKNNLLTFIPGLNDKQQFISTAIVDIKGASSYLIGGSYKNKSSSQYSNALLVVDKQTHLNKGQNTVRNTIILKLENNAEFRDGIKSIAIFGDILYFVDNNSNLWYLDLCDINGANVISFATIHKIELLNNTKIEAIYSSNSESNISHLYMLVKNDTQNDITNYIYSIHDYKVCKKAINNDRNRYSEFGFKLDIKDGYYEENTILSIKLNKKFLPQDLYVGDNEAYVLTSLDLQDENNNNIESSLYKYSLINSSESFKPMKLPPLMTSFVVTNNTFEFIGIGATYKKQAVDKLICTKPITRIFDVKKNYVWELN